MTTLINGTRLATRRSGSGDPLVLVHANISDMRSWNPIEGLLAENFEVINYSRRFAHPNPPIEPGVPDELDVHAADLHALIDKLNVGPVHVLANSSGAFISLLAADRRPELFRSLSLEEPPVVSMFLDVLPPTPSAMLKLLFTAPGALIAFMKFGATTMGPTIKAFERGDNEAALDAFATGLLGASGYASISPERRAQMVDNLAMHRATFLDAGLPTFTLDQARALRVPTQLIRGAHTSHFQRRVNQRLAQLIPGARDVVISDASHLTHEDNPVAVAETVRAFVRSAEAS